MNLNTENGLSFIASQYERINAKFMPPILFTKVKQYYKDGLEADVIVRAFEKSAERSAGWEYTEGILKRLLTEQIYTAGIWDKQLEIKRNLKELENRYSGFCDEKVLVMLAHYLAFKEEYRAIEDKLTLYMSAPEQYQKIMFPNGVDFDIEAIRAEAKKRTSPN